MSHTNYRYESKDDTRRKLLSHLYTFFDFVIAFFAVWTFASAMKIVIGFTTEIFWLAKAWIQQVTFIAVALIVFCVVLAGQAMYEKAMIKKKVWIPKSFIIITSVIALIYLVCKLIVVLY